MKEPLVCSVCGAGLTKETANEFEGQIMCASCLEEETTLCDCCGERISYSSNHGNDAITLCIRCFEHNYTTCEECGALIRNDNAYYFDDSDYPYCSECYQSLRDNGPIKEYNYKPEPIFYGSGDLFMGVELEIDKGGEYNSNAQKLLNIANARAEHIYCKHDGSIEEGFEIVSHPMTLGYHTDKMNWKAVFEAAVSMDYRSHQTTTCGLHIHVSRHALGSTIDAQEDVISRIVYFVENHWNELLKFSRRTEANINRWASRYGISTTAKDTYKSSDGNFRTVFKNNHGRIIFIALKLEENTFSIVECYYVDRTQNGKYFAAPKKLKTFTFQTDEMLSVVAEELDRTFNDSEVVFSHSDLSTEDFIQLRLSELNHGYKFLIFVGEGEPANGMPSVLRTRFKNRIHRSLYSELQYRRGKGVITDCRYYDREYKSRAHVIPETLHTVYFEYNRQAILNIVNNELNTAFTDIIFVTDGSLDISKKLPLCGYIT